MGKIVLLVGISICASFALAQEVSVVIATGTFVSPPPLTARLGKAEIVVFGTAGESRVARVRDDPNVQPSDDVAYQKGSYEETDFRVDQYLKGTGPETVKIRYPASTADLVVIPTRISAEPPLEGRPVVLLLAPGEGPFVGAYAVLGKSNVAYLLDDGKTAEFQETGEQVTLEELRKLATNR